MRTFFDTSVLVPVFFEQHEHHERSLAVIARQSKRSAFCGVHSLAEVYATLTRMPGPNRVSGEQAMLFLSDIRKQLTIVPLDGEEYYRCLEECAVKGIAGGSTYDALLAQCALKIRAEAIYTWNVRHYRLLGSEVTKRLRTP